MKEAHNLPAVRHTTILGLNLLKTFELSPWFRSLPAQLAVTPEGKGDLATTQPLQSTSSDEKPSLNLREPLDGAVHSFCSLFSPNLSQVDAEGTEKRNHTSSTESLTILRPPGSVISFNDDPESTTIRQTLIPVDLVLKDIEQSPVGINSRAQQQESALSIPVACLFGNGGMDPFCAFFPSDLLSDRADRRDQPKKNTSQSTHAYSSSNPSIQTFGHGSAVSSHRMFSNQCDTTADDLGGLDSGSSSMGIDGHSSPAWSVISGETCSSLSDTLNSSRRSSWATSTNTLCEDDENTQPSLIHAKFVAEPDETSEHLELLHEYRHYHEVVDMGTPQNLRNRDFCGKGPITGAKHEALKPEQATRIGEDLVVEMEAIASDGPIASVRKALSHAEEQMQSEDPPALDSKGTGVITPLSTPAEVVAWEHSYCQADPESAKLKLLIDDHGREFVLYHDCFHCVPIELASEFVCVIGEAEDGFGSATETCEAARGPEQLVTIPEEEEQEG
ncbi:hypothetical protein Daus18300_005068 [Diaporthe australafricana]|uniref:Uncharacterized protein n=1 Tax=Diaporthe australafricana TaxID=127596 RepID=A0ABR3X4X2_9PEZI